MSVLATKTSKHISAYGIRASSDKSGENDCCITRLQTAAIVFAFKRDGSWSDTQTLKDQGDAIVTLFSQSRSGHSTTMTEHVTVTYRSTMHCSF